MAHSALFVLSIAVTCLVTETHQLVDQRSFQLMEENLEWPSTMSLYDEFGDSEDEDGGGSLDRRSLYGRGKPMHYYISYGALSANRVPCPPRSGRSYYTHDCFGSRTQFVDLSEISIVEWE
ncbi:conserved hypothetical protein [Ricinus communis]|uniref:RALFL33 n=1 Tax=Ricinus communis TaxID=3988 RepID=B9R7A5_RICCO|nr:conserved hypothetical protein [Ricinus communis]